MSTSKKDTKASLAREPGKSLLPLSRVQKIMKADKELPMVAKEATFLISLATEEFIKRLSLASQQVAAREKRAVVQQRDISTVVRKADEFAFLSNILGNLDGSTATREKPRRREQGQDQPQEATLLDHFVQKSTDAMEEDGTAGDVIMNEDGTMSIS